MSKPSNYSVLSAGLPTLSRKANGKYGDDKQPVFIRVLQGLLLVAFLAILIAGAIYYTLNRTQAWHGLFRTVSAQGAEISPASDQTQKAKDLPAAPSATANPTGSNPAGAVVTEPKSNPPSDQAQKPTDSVTTPAVPTDKTQPDNAGGTVVEPAKGTGISILVNRTHALSSSYVPAGLVEVQVRLRPGITADEKFMQPEAAKALESMVQKAEQDGIILYAASGYRSYATQKGIYDWRVQAQGQAAADLYTAHPGQSEHQTGLAMDLSDKSGELEETFAQTPEGKWLAANAQDFGFILRYPQGKESITGYNYEPWHFRYVGVTAAKEIKASGLVLEQYLK